MTLIQLEQSARALGEALRQTPVVEEYLKAREGLEDDEEALQLLEKQARIQTATQAMHVRGAITVTDLEEISQIQRKVNGKVNAYLDAQEKLRIFFRRVNGELSRLLGFDFASLAGKTGCC